MFRDIGLFFKGLFVVPLALLGCLFLWLQERHTIGVKEVFESGGNMVAVAFFEDSPEAEQGMKEGLDLAMKTATLVSTVTELDGGKRQFFRFNGLLVVPGRPAVRFATASDTNGRTVVSPIYNVFVGEQAVEHARQWLSLNQYKPDDLALVWLSTHNNNTQSVVPRRGDSSLGVVSYFTVNGTVFSWDGHVVTDRGKQGDYPRDYAEALAALAK